MSIYKFDDLYNIRISGVFEENSEWNNSEFTVALYVKEKKVLNNQLFFSLNPDHHGTIIDFILSPTHRNKGIGQYMYYCLIDYLYKNNIPVEKIRGSISPSDKKQNGDLLVHLYTKIGFIVGENSFGKEIGNLYTELLLQENIQKSKKAEIERKIVEEAYFDLKRKNKNIINQIKSNKLCRFFYNLNNDHKI